MPRCIHCAEEFLDSLRRCPHCGEAQDEASLSRSGESADAPSLSLGHVARRRRHRMIIALVAVGIIALGGVSALPLLGPASTESEEASNAPVLDTRPNWDKLEAPTEVKGAPAKTGFEIISARVVDGEVHVKGKCSPAAAARVTVDGLPATRSPDGERFHAIVPLDDGSVEVVVHGVGGDTAKEQMDATVVGEPDPAAAGLRLASHVDGATLHEDQAHVRVTSEDPRSAPVRDATIALNEVENRIEAGQRSFALYRAPKGMVFLRTTATGHRTFLRRADGSEMVLIPGGVARRGAGDAPPHGPAHLVRLRPFLIDRNEVTCAQFAVFLNHVRRANDVSLRHSDDPGRLMRPLGWTSDEPPAGSADLPVTGVSWYAAYSYARWVGGRLPTEAEWERAGAGPQGLPYPWGENFEKGRCAWRTGGPVRADSVPEGEGACALLHMSGNVREWCDDRYDPRWYRRGSRTNPRGPSRGLHRVVRGGSFASPFEALRLQHRDQLDPSQGYSDVGFRVARRWIESGK